MGCGSSTDSKASGTATSSRASSSTRTPTLRNKVAPEAFIEADTLSTDSGIDSAKTRPRRPHQEVISNKTETSNNNEPKLVGQKSVTFDVVVGDGSGDSTVRKPPPRRLQKLENAPHPTITLEQLEHQQQKSAVRRKKALEKKTISSKQSSRRRNELLAAVKFSQDHQQHVTVTKLEEKIDSASKNREKHQADMIRKHNMRETKAKQARERRLREHSEDDNFDVEKDEMFNADDDLDSWLDGVNDVFASSPLMGSASERLYNGYSSPAKHTQGGSGDQRRKLGNTIESEQSETEAFNSQILVNFEKNAEKDDFFD